LPVPEGALERLEAVRAELHKSSPPDVSSIDVFWPGILSEDLTNLKPYLSTEVASMNPSVLASYIVNGRLVAIPYSVDIGVLFYRKDLLQEYGYTKPPETWDELEKMAARIQRGERAKGQGNFWGYVWPGVAGEGLTCNALEWQAAKGGGRIIEAAV
jgi:trehalose/maltose transport system substrate-binding protein